MPYKFNNFGEKRKAPKGQKIIKSYCLCELGLSVLYRKRQTKIWLVIISTYITRVKVAFVHSEFCIDIVF